MPPGWIFSDEVNPIGIVGSYAVNNSSHYFYMTKGTNEGNNIKIEVTATPGGSGQNHLHIERKDRTSAHIRNVKIYQNEDGSEIRSDNQTTQSSNEYKVTPNPFSDHLNITIDTPEKGEVVVNLFDVTGSLRKTVTLPANELDNQNYTIATSDLLAGMYIMQVRTSAGVQQVSKVFKL
jgi:hypothetical protein